MRGNVMFLNENKSGNTLPLYEVQELTMHEALLVLSAEKALLESRQAVFARYDQLRKVEAFSMPNQEIRDSH